MSKKSLVVSSGVLIVGAIGGACLLKSGLLQKKEVENNGENLAEEKHSIIVQGAEVYYKAKITNAKQKTLILIHGAGATADAWRGVVSQFESNNFNWVTLDLPAHRHSKGEAKETIEESAEFIKDFVQALRKEYKLKNDFTLVGHSYGGAITTELAIQNPAWLKSAVLICTSPNFTRASSEEFIDKLSKGELDLEFCRLGFSPSNAERFYNITVRSMSAVDVKTTYADFKAASQYNKASELSNIKIPVLIIEGKDDVIMPKNSGRLFLHRIRKAEMVTLSDVGHFATIESPLRVATEIEEFVTK